MMQKRFGDAESHFKKALKLAPNDYTGLSMMSTCKLFQKKYKEGITYAEKAQQVYPQQAQAYHLSGFAKIQHKRISQDLTKNLTSMKNYYLAIRTRFSSKAMLRKGCNTLKKPPPSTTVICSSCGRARRQNMPIRA